MPRSAAGLWHRRLTVACVVLLVGWSLWGSVVGRGTLVNPAGLGQVGRFTAAAIHPELSSKFLAVVVRAALVTAAYAVVGTMLAVVIGIAGGVLTSETWWAAGTTRHRRTRGLSHPVRRVLLLLALVPRGMHEAIWALILIAVLGRNPFVAILAIGVPFGAITARAVADLIDDRGRDTMAVLRTAGAGRMSAMLYGVAPIIGRDVVSYGFYRFECALRTSVVLGMIGAGGLGFELAVSFQSLRYNEIWTLIFTLLLLSAIADWWGSTLRRRPSRLRLVSSLTVVAALATLAAVWLELDPTSLYSSRTRRLAADLGRSAWPPRLPHGRWSELVQATGDTVQLSVIAICLAASVAVPISLIAARRREAGHTWRCVGWLTRVGLLVARSIPPTVWALIVLFVLFPGPLPGGVALGLYTIGVLGRLSAEAVENADPNPAAVLHSAGAGPVSSFAYGTLPTLAPRFASITTYRWEVAARETVIVGLVGAGGLGRLLAQQNAAFDRAAMLTTVAALIVVSATIDLAGRALRRGLR